MREHFIKNKNSNDFTETCKAVFHIISNKFGHTARITDIFEMLRLATGLEEFMVLDFNNIQHGEFQSYLINTQIDWISGKDVDFTELYQAILTAGDFLESEKRIFETGKIEERLWGIMLAITDPDNKNKL